MVGGLLLTWAHAAAPTPVELLKTIGLLPMLTHLDSKQFLVNHGTGNMLYDFL
jgi:hypothetical protein